MEPTAGKAFTLELRGLDESHILGRSQVFFIVVSADCGGSVCRHERNCSNLVGKGKLSALTKYLVNVVNMLGRWYTVGTLEL